MTKSEYKVLYRYRYQTCPFVPTKDVSFEEMSDVVEGSYEKQEIIKNSITLVL